jgi:beta-glucosidase-like glycosyl hydrolase
LTYDRRARTLRAVDTERAIARRMVIGLPESGCTSEWKRDFSNFPPAGVIVFRGDFESLEDLRRLTAHLRELARPRRLVIAMDEEGGWVSQLCAHLAVPPNAMLLARGAVPGDIERAARVTGERLRALGVDWVFAPVADVNALAANPVIGPRSFGTDPATAARGIAAAVRGYRAARVACCLKHFPGHGSTALDSHLALPRCDADRATLEARDLAPFRAGAGAEAVMTAHVVYPALDPDHPATFSRAIVHDLLRGILGFPGICITDSLEMKAVAKGRTPLETATLALEAGSDLLLLAQPDGAWRQVRRGLAESLEAGRLDGAGFDLAEDRLRNLHRTCPEPTPEESGRPVESLTPAGWEEWLAEIAGRGLIVRGSLPREAATLPWRIAEPPGLEGPALRDCLASAGIPPELLLSGPADPIAGAIGLVAIASRVPLPEAEIERLRGFCRARPTVLVGLQNDAFLEALPEAVVRVSAADATTAARRAVASAVAGVWRAAGGQA